MPTLLAALGYAALTLLLTYPVSVAPAARALGVDADANRLAYSENLLGHALVGAPVIWLTDNPVLALNAVALLSCVLCGLGALPGRLRPRVLAAVISASSRR